MALFKARLMIFLVIFMLVEYKALSEARFALFMFVLYEVLFDIFGVCLHEAMVKPRLVIVVLVSYDLLFEAHSVAVAACFAIVMFVLHEEI